MSPGRLPLQFCGSVNARASGPARSGFVWLRGEPGDGIEYANDHPAGAGVRNLIKCRLFVGIGLPQRAGFSSNAGAEDSPANRPTEIWTADGGEATRRWTLESKRFGCVQEFIRIPDRRLILIHSLGGKSTCLFRICAAKNPNDFDIAMTQAVQSTPDYTMGFSDEILRVLNRYSAQTSAAHLLPRLRPGMRVLDFGCGPGSISAGLAQAVDPGELHGVDMEASQVELAGRFAESKGCRNAFFSVGDVTRLDFADEFFDVAHCHNVLMHVPDTEAVLAEVKRVLKPGGLISGREMNCQSCFTNPDFGVIRRAWDMFEDLLIADDGHPQMGKDLKIHLAAAGFESIEVGASFDVYSSPEDVAFIYDAAQQWFLAPEITEAAIKYGAATETLCGHIATAYERWRDHPGAVAGIAFGEALARKPLA